MSDAPPRSRALLSRRSAFLLALTGIAVVAANLLVVRDAAVRAEEVRVSGTESRAATNLDSLESALRERDASGAAYVATGNDRYRLRADRLGPTVRARLGSLNDSRRQPEIDALRVEAEKALKRTDAAMALRAGGRREDALARLDAGQGTPEPWEPLLARLREDQRQRLAQAERQTLAEMRSASWHALIWSLATLALLLLGYVFLRRDNARLAALAEEDELTGLKNRRVFLEQATQAFQLARRHTLPLSLLMVDVDLFKGYNDEFGHVAGDAALVKVADVLRRAARASDTVARYGGEEFVVLLPHTDGPQALLAAERLRAALAEDPTPHRPLTVSVGIAFLKDEMQSATELIQSADRGLYRAKYAGRDIAAFDD